MNGAAIMAKAKKPKDSAAKKPVKPEAEEIIDVRDTWTRKPLVFQMRGSEEWKAWVESLAEKEGDSAAKLIERALRDYARKVGHPDPPKR